MTTTKSNIHIHIFRRDFRLKDNTALYECWNTQSGSTTPQFDKILGIFIFTPQQVTEKNNYKSEHAIQFMIESLQSLNHEMNDNLGVLYGDESDILKSLLKNKEIVSISWNRDYTPYSKKRDEKMRKIINSHRKDSKDSKDSEQSTISISTPIARSFHDLYLVPPAEGFVYPSSKTPEDVYTVFTPFYKAVISELKKRNPQIKPSVSRSIEWTSLASLKHPPKKSQQITLSDALIKFVGKEASPKVNVEGGRDAGMYRLTKIKRGDFDKYTNCRDCLTYETTYLSAYLKFGCVSVREAYEAMNDAPSSNAGKNMIRELIWRDYFGHILNRYPRLLGEPYQEKFKNIKWRTNREQWEAWKAGRTGFPVVDAGMRQMNATGYMHNRCRMIVSSFLVKLLRMDWRKGERYFAQTLVDYDVASNNGGWQDSAGSGAGSQPYFRIFNPWTQAKDYDPNAEYIKQWIPELNDLSSEEILDWEKKATRERCREKYDSLDYPDPIIDYKEERKKTLEQFKKELNKN